MENTKIEVLRDTNVVMDNTADSLRVVLTEEKPTIEPSVEIAGQIVKGKDLIVVNTSSTTLGDLKTALTYTNDRIAQLQNEIISEQNNLIRIQSMIDAITPEVQKVIDTILSEMPVNIIKP